MLCSDITRKSAARTAPAPPQFREPPGRRSVTFYWQAPAPRALTSPAREGHMKETLQWGVIGTGGIATAFAQALTKSRRCRIANVTGLTPELTRAFADQHHIPATAASVEELLADKAVEAVYVATPLPFHEKM